MCIKQIFRKYAKRHERNNTTVIFFADYRLIITCRGKTKQKIMYVCDFVYDKKTKTIMY